MTTHSTEAADGHDHADGSHRPPLTVEDWDARYRDAQVWSGEPNGALVAEVAGMTPGAAIDVGCGEGADAIHLARLGWRTTALDLSPVAVERARAAGEAAGVDVTWVAASLEAAPASLGTFDLVAASYLAVPRTDDALMERALLQLVAPGGTLLAVHHADTSHPSAQAFVSIDAIAEAVPTDWRIVRHERRERQVSGGAGAHHHEDVVLRVTRPA